MKQAHADKCQREDAPLQPVVREMVRAIARPGSAEFTAFVDRAILDLTGLTRAAARDMLADAAELFCSAALADPELVAPGRGLGPAEVEVFVADLWRGVLQAITRRGALAGAGVGSA